MRALLSLVSYLAVLIISTSVPANPIPYPFPAAMPLEDMYAYLSETDESGLEVRFIGNYYFMWIPDDVTEMKYPLPPESSEISVDMGQLPDYWIFSEYKIPYIHELNIALEPLSWFYIDETYPTVLPRWPEIPMIAWDGPFPEKALLTVEYSHSLPKFRNGHLFFYALGTGKYDLTYQKGAFAFLDISMPAHLSMERLYLDKTPYPFAVTWEEDDDGETRKIVSVFAKGDFDGFTQDIIGYITDWKQKFDRDIDDSDVEELDIDHARVASGSSRQSQLLLRYEAEQCGTTEPPLLETSIRASGKKILVTDPIFFNCCAEYVRMTISLEYGVVVFREKAMEEAPCDCVCYYPMQGVAGPFKKGIYEVVLLDPHGELILYRQIEIK